MNKNDVKLSKLDKYIKRDFSKIDYKLDSVFKNDYYSLIIVIIIISVSALILYQNPFWSYIFVLLLFILFILILRNKDFTTFNIFKKIASFILKPISLVFIILENIFKSSSVQNTVKTRSILSILGIIGIIILVILFLCLKFIFKTNNCKYNLHLIKNENEQEFNNSDICSNLELDNCYTLEELQPCLKDLSSVEKECNYCLDYDYNKCNNKTEQECTTNTNSNCIWQNNKCNFKKDYCNNILDKTGCNKSSNTCKWDENNDKCNSLISNQCNEITTLEECNDTKTLDGRCNYNLNTDTCELKLVDSSRFCSKNSNFNINWFLVTIFLIIFIFMIIEKSFNTFQSETGIKYTQKAKPIVAVITVFISIVIYIINIITKNDIEKSDLRNINIKCKSNKFCQQNLDIKECKEPFKFNKNSFYVMYGSINILGLLAMYILPSFGYNIHHCISNKAFILTILLVNILILSLVIFLQNTGDNTSSNEELF